MTKGVHGKIDIWMEKKEIQKRKRKSSISRSPIQ